MKAAFVAQATDPVFQGITIQVVRGTLLLDAYFGDPMWDWDVNLEDLRLSDGAVCILGQTFGKATRQAYTVARRSLPEEKYRDLTANYIYSSFDERIREQGGFFIGSSVLEAWGDLNPYRIKKIDARYEPDRFGFVQPECYGNGQVRYYSDAAGRYRARPCNLVGCQHPDYTDLTSQWRTVIRRRHAARRLDVMRRMEENRRVEAVPA